MLKDSYSVDFLTTGKKAKEREIENALIEHIKKFLLELGQGPLMSSDVIATTIKRLVFYCVKRKTRL